ncbi:MAG TPA: PRC-barrel domain-containing protein, partial [Burkholderiaceae bacterium]|nr:PRC-barrel domain-containing protein [Burkholderiaceae bacterium]
MANRGLPLALRIAPLVLTLAGGGAATAAIDRGAPGAVERPATQEAHHERLWLLSAQRLIGTEVRNAAGERLGQIDEIVVDVAAGRASFAVISAGGFLGIGAGRFAYPLPLLQPVPGREALVLDVPRERLAQAPAFDHRQIPDWNEYLGRVERFWGTAWGTRWTAGATDPQRPAAPAGHVGASGVVGATPDARPPRAHAPLTASEAVAAGSPAAPPPGVQIAPLPPEIRDLRAVRTRDIVGRTIRDPQKQRIGQLRDLVLDVRTGEVAFAVIAFDSGWFEAGRLVALPIREFRRDALAPHDLV